MLGVRVKLPESEVVVLLSERAGPLTVPIVIGPREGAAIASAQAGIVPPRPQTHDLLLAVVDHLGSGVTEVRIVELREGTFYAQLVLRDGSMIDSRASDAIALALRAQAPIRCAVAVIEAAGMVIDVEGESDGEDDVEDAQVAEFRSFLDQVTPGDFDLPPPPREGGPGQPEHPA